MHAHKYACTHTHRVDEVEEEDDERRQLFKRCRTKG